MSKRNFWNNIKRLAILLLGLPISFTAGLVRRDTRVVVLTSFMNRTFDSNSKFLFQWLFANRQDLKVYFVVNDSQKAQALRKEYPGAIIDTRRAMGVLRALQAGTWFLSHMETPLGGFLHAWFRTVVYIGHGAPLKNIGLSERNLGWAKRLYYRIQRTNISHALSTSEFYRPIIARFLGISTRKVIISPQPRNSGIAEPQEKSKALAVPSDRIAVLYAPTWRPYAITKLFPFPDFDLEKLEELLSRERIELFIRTHPRIHESLPTSIFQVPGVRQFSERICPEVMDVLGGFDQLITDYSSIYFDFLPLNRPIIFLPYDLDRYRQEIGFVHDYDALAPGPQCFTWEEFSRALVAYRHDPDLHSEQRRRVNMIVNGHSGAGSETLVGALVQSGLLPVGPGKS